MREGCSTWSGDVYSSFLLSATPDGKTNDCWKTTTRVQNHDRRDFSQPRRPRSPFIVRSRGFDVTFPDQRLPPLDNNTGMPTNRLNITAIQSTTFVQVFPRPTPLQASDLSSEQRPLIYTFLDAGVDGGGSYHAARAPSHQMKQGKRRTLFS